MKVWAPGDFVLHDDLNANFAGVPNRIARLDLVGVTAAISNVILYTPVTTGLYRLSAYLRLSTAGTAGTLNARFTVNDGVGPIDQDLPLAPASGGAAGGAVVVRALAGQPFNYSVVYTGVTGTPVYNLMLTCECIG